MSRFPSLPVFILALALSFGLAHGQSSVYVTSVQGEAGTAPDDSVLVSQPIVWTIALRNSSGGAVIGSGNGFNIHDNGTGSEWPIPKLDTLNIAPTTGAGWKTRFDLAVLVFNDLDNNGGVGARNADTMGITGANIFGAGFPDGFDFNVITITIPSPGINPGHAGKTICLDSARYDVAQTDWLWSTTAGGVIPDWPGPYCYKIFDPNAPPVNQAPILAAIGNKSVNENVLLSFGVSATDADGTMPTFTTSTLPTGATFINNGNGTGTFSWTPTFAQAGGYPITFRATDGALVDTEVVTITVNNVNQAPILAVIGNKSVNENVLLSFGVSATDADGTTPTFTTSTLPTGATFVNNGNGTGTFSWTPTFAQAGGYPITFRAIDGALVDTEVVTITVNNVNQAPILAAIGNKSVNENVLLSFGVSATDADGSTPTFTASTLPTGATFVNNGNGTGTFSWTPTFAQAGGYPITFRATDGALVDTEVVTITVNNINQAPILAAIGNKSVDENVLLSFGVSATDADGTAPTFTTSTLPTGATFIDNLNGTGTFNWTPTLEQSGVYNVTFRATDAQLAVDSEIVQITVNMANNPPVISPINDTAIFEGETLTIDVNSSDADDDQIYLFPGPLPDNMSFNYLSGPSAQIIFNPNFNQAGSYPVIVNASDQMDTASESFTVTVLDKEPGTEGNTLQVGSVPAVPGQQIVVPIDIANSCDVYGIYVPIQWDGDNFIVLDSVIFNDALVGHLSAKSVDISNDSNFALITVQVIAPDLPIPPGDALLADMYFSFSPVTPHGVYGVTPGLTTTTFTRNCGGGVEDIIPIIPGGGGNTVVDTNNVYVCGYVVDEIGVGIGGATVQLWPDFPCDGPIQSTLTNGEGAFAFTDFTLGSFDLYAYKRGQDSTTWNDAYYPQDVHVNFGENGIMIALRWLNVLISSDQWVDYFCGVNTLFNCPLPVGSIVEARDEDNIFCGRQFVREPGVYRFMPVYRDSSGSVEDEGAVTDDNLRFYVNGIQALTDGNTIYPAQYEQVLVCLAGGARLTQECQLEQGWNLSSWYLDTDSDNIEEVLSSLNGCLDVVLGFERGGLTYVPGMDLFNTLTAVDHLSGYWIKIKENATCYPILEIQGVPVDRDIPRPLDRGWNLVSYPMSIGEPFTDVNGDGIFQPGVDIWDRLTQDLDTNGLYDGPDKFWTSPYDALRSILENLEIAYTYRGSPLIFVPTVDPFFNTLTKMEPCYGYWLKMTSADILTYPTYVLSGELAKEYSPAPFATGDVSNRKVEPTRNWVNMYSYNLTLDGQPVSIGAAVTAHNHYSQVIGHYEMKASGTFGFMPVYADAQNETVAGIKKGESFYLSVDGIKTAEEFTWTEQGALIEVAALTSGSGPGDILPDSYVLLQNYPNPFNPSTTISFSLPIASQATLEIFNLLGQKVATPYDGLAEAGEHRIEWDGRTITGETASSGIYLYRLTAGQYVKTLKMTLVK